MPSFTQIKSWFSLQKKSNNVCESKNLADTVVRHSRDDRDPVPVPPEGYSIWRAEDK